MENVTESKKKTNFKRFDQNIYRVERFRCELIICSNLHLHLGVSNLRIAILMKTGK